MINKNEWKNLQKLACLKFDDSELDDFVEKLTNVTNKIDELLLVGCTNIDPLMSVREESQPLRVDEITEGNITEEILSNAPNVQNNLAKQVKCFIVPKVIE